MSFIVPTAPRPRSRSEADRTADRDEPCRSALVRPRTAVLCPPWPPLRCENGRGASIICLPLLVNRFGHDDASLIYDGSEGRTEGRQPSAHCWRCRGDLSRSRDGRGMEPGHRARRRRRPRRPFGTTFPMLGISRGRLRGHSRGARGPTTEIFEGVADLQGRITLPCRGPCRLRPTERPMVASVRTRARVDPGGAVVWTTTTLTSRTSLRAALGDLGTDHRSSRGHRLGRRDAPARRRRARGRRRGGRRRGGGGRKEAWGCRKRRRGGAMGPSIRPTRRVALTLELVLPAPPRAPGPARAASAPSTSMACFVGWPRSNSRYGTAHRPGRFDSVGERAWGCRRTAVDHA